VINDYHSQIRDERWEGVKGVKGLRQLREAGPRISLLGVFSYIVLCCEGHVQVLADDVLAFFS